MVIITRYGGLSASDARSVNIWTIPGRNEPSSMQGQGQPLRKQPRSPNRRLGSPARADLASLRSPISASDVRESGTSTRPHISPENSPASIRDPVILPSVVPRPPSRILLLLRRPPGRHEDLLPPYQLAQPGDAAAPSTVVGGPAAEHARDPCFTPTPTETPRAALKQAARESAGTTTCLRL